MAIGNPSFVFNNELRGVTRNPKFAELSPASQAALSRLANEPQGSTMREFQTNTDAYTEALAEARQKGLLSDTPLWQEILKGVGIAGGVAAAGPLIGALGGGGSAAAPTLTGAAPGPLAADEAFAAGPVAGTGLSGVDLTGMGAASGTGFGAALKAALPTIIGAGASLGGAAIASHGNTEAAKIAAASADKALAQAEEIYQQQRADQSPYRSLGASALGPLSFGLGLPTPTSSAGPLDNPSTVVASGAKDANGQPMPGAGQNQIIPPPPTHQQEFGTLGQIGASPSTGDLVPIRNQATGLVHLIPGDQVPSALQAGGMRV